MRGGLDLDPNRVNTFWCGPEFGQLDQGLRVICEVETRDELCDAVLFQCQ